MTVVQVHCASVKEFRVIRMIDEGRAESISCWSWEELRAVLHLLGVAGLRLDYLMQELEISADVEVRCSGKRKSQRRGGLPEAKAGGALVCTLSDESKARGLVHRQHEELPEAHFAQVVVK